MILEEKMISKNILGILSDLALLFPAFTLVFTIRGFFKALAAKLMGDDTAKNSGYLTLNPVVHIDFYGLLIMLFVLVVLGSLFFDSLPRAYLFMFLMLIGARWSIPTPIIDANFKNYKTGVVLTSMAGSIGNFVLALLFLYITNYFPYQILPEHAVLTMFQLLRTFIEFSIFFGVLDLVPLPPFDAGKLLQFILPKKLSYISNILEEYSIFVLMFLFVLPITSDVFFKFLAIMTMVIEKFLTLLVF